jgi:hypothetical protein
MCINIYIYYLSGKLYKLEGQGVFNTKLPQYLIKHEDILGSEGIGSHIILGIKWRQMISFNLSDCIPRVSSLKHTRQQAV